MRLAIWFLILAACGGGRSPADITSTEGGAPDRIDATVEMPSPVPIDALAACTPSCTGQTCGDDSCGGTCSCVVGVCSPAGTCSTRPALVSAVNNGSLGEASASVVAVFYAVQLPDTCPEVARDGACRLRMCGPGASASAADAGQLRVTTPQRSLVIDRDPLGFYNLFDRTASLWSAGDLVTVSAAGAAVPPFTRALDAPRSIVVTSPTKPAPADPLVIDRARDLVVRWTGGGPGTIMVSLANVGGEFLISCELDPAAGAGVIPASLLRGYRAEDGTLTLRSEHHDRFAAGAWDVQLVLLDAAGSFTHPVRML
jgi:hypothetical protein